MSAGGRAYLLCSSAAGREKYIQATFLGWTVPTRAGFIPRWLLDCASAGKRTPRVRLCGRSAHEASVRTAKMRAQIILPTSSPLATLDAAAPVILMKVPAYAHSLSRGKPGTSKAIAPSGFHTPRILSKYAG